MFFGVWAAKIAFGNFSSPSTKTLIVGLNGHLVFIWYYVIYMNFLKKKKFKEMLHSYSFHNNFATNLNWKFVIDFNLGPQLIEYVLRWQGRSDFAVFSHLFIIHVGGICFKFSTFIIANRCPQGYSYDSNSKQEHFID